MIDIKKVEEKLQELFWLKEELFTPEQNTKESMSAEQMLVHLIFNNRLCPDSRGKTTYNSIDDYIEEAHGNRITPRMLLYMYQVIERKMADSIRLASIYQAMQEWINKQATK